MSMSSNLRKALAFGAFASILLCSSSAFSACYSGRAGLSPDTVADFKANPAGLLQQAGPDGTARVISRIRDLVASDPSTLPTVMNLLGNSNTSTAMQTAIGAGLGQAAAICTRNDPDFARAIQQAVAASNVPAAVTAFAGASGDRSTAAGGAGGGGGGVGGSVGGGAPGGGTGGGGTTGAGSPGNGTSAPTLSSGGNTGGGTAGLGSNSSQSASP